MSALTIVAIIAGSLAGLYVLYRIIAFIYVLIKRIIDHQQEDFDKRQN